MDIPPDKKDQEPPPLSDSASMLDLDISDRLELTRRESLMLLETLENPPPRSEAFLQAQARYARNKKDEEQTS